MTLLVFMHNVSVFMSNMPVPMSDLQASISNMSSLYLGMFATENVSEPDSLFSESISETVFQHEGWVELIIK